jgi:hypothetical protein
MSKKKERERYAEVCWVADDVKTLRPKWSLKRCEEELNAIERDIQDRMVERGWSVLQQLLPLK